MQGVGHRYTWGISIVVLYPHGHSASEEVTSFDPILFFIIISHHHFNITVCECVNWLKIFKFALAIASIRMECGLFDWKRDKSIVCILYGRKVDFTSCNLLSSVEIAYFPLLQHNIRILPSWNNEASSRDRTNSLTHNGENFLIQTSTS